MRPIMVFILVVLVCAALPVAAWPQDATADSTQSVTMTSTQATTLAGQSLVSLTNGVNVTDVTLHRLTRSA